MEPYGTANIFKVKFSRSRFAWWAAALVGLTLAWVGIAHHVLRTEADTFDILVLPFIVLFLVLGTVGFVWRGLTSPDTVLVLSPEGLRFAWLSPQTIPWSEIRSVRLQKIGFSKLIWLRLEPEFERTLTLPGWHRWTRALPLPGSKEFAIGSHALSIDADYLHDQLIRYAGAHGQLAPKS